MMSASFNDTDELVRRAASGDRRALDQLLDRYRERLRQMVALYMDRRLASRIDASDVVQEALVEAARQLSEYVDKRPKPFYVWLRQLAWERLIDLSRRHIRARCRSVQDEVAWPRPLPEESAMGLAERLAASGTSPSGHMQRKELRRQVRDALSRLAPADHKVLVLWYMEQLSAQELGAVLEITEQAVRRRHRRALEHLGRLLGTVDPEE